MNKILIELKIPGYEAFPVVVEREKVSPKGRTPIYQFELELEIEENSKIDKA
jgi:hypothetical protein